MSPNRRGLLGLPRMTLLQLGLAFVVVSLLAGVALFQKHRIISALSPGTTITAEFAQNYRLRPYVSDVKIAGVPIGKVTGIERTAPGVTEMSLKVDDDALDVLGTAPRAEIRPTTLLGGNYYLDLQPGGIPGEFDGVIPVDRTGTPVEMDKVAAALQPDAREGIRTSIDDLDATLERDGSAALKDLTRDAPDTLGPAAGVFTGLQGTRPDTDLTALVDGLEATGRVLSEQNGQLAGIVTDLRETAGVLGRRGADLGGFFAEMPRTLDSAEAGLARLDVTLGKLRETAGPAGPTVEELGVLLRRIDPVLVEARPVVRDLRTVAADARPLVEDLVPASERLTGVFDDVRGPVLDRINGPIMDTVNSPFEGTGRYAGSGADRPLYQELGYMVSNISRATMTDENGAMIAFHAGGGPGTVAGLPISLEQMFRQLADPQEAGR
jgi:phospholipid/cholesterol/gamma-HCH transport system substrate-binding protein